MTEILRTARSDVTLEAGDASLPRRPLSRRALIKAAAIAPFVALARKAWANSKPENMAAIAAYAPISDVQLQAAKAAGKAHAETRKQALDLDKFELVVRALWLHFHLGLGVAQPDKDISEKGLLMALYNGAPKGGRKTGEIVVENVLADKFDPLGNDYQTNVCVYLCGHKVGITASAKDPPVFSETMYENALTDTQTEMCKKLRKACKSSEYRPGSLGFGC